MKVLRFICYTGIWLLPCVVIAGLKILSYYSPEKEISNNTVLLLVLFGCCLVAYVWSQNAIAKANGKTTFGPFDAFGSASDPMYLPSKKHKARRGIDLPPCLLSQNPSGVLFGRTSGRYVRKSLSEDGHVFIIGGSGSGKTSGLIIPTLLANPETPAFVLDIKGELHSKAVKRGDRRVVVFDPDDIRAAGYDPLYRLRGREDEQVLIETMRGIAISLIPMPKGKDPFWILSAKNLLTGLLIYYYRGGLQEFIDLVDEILQRPVEEAVEDVLDHSAPDAVERKYIAQFSVMAEETLGGIVAELNNHLVIFVNDFPLRYALRNNPIRASPLVLEQGQSFYLAIQEHKLTAYADVLQLILNQFLSELEKRSETAAPVLFVIDELPRIVSAGKLDRLLDGVRTLRSRNVTLVLVSQSVEGLMSAYTEAEVTDLISNCSYVVVLSASSEKTQRMVGNWCGQFREIRKGWSGSGAKRSPNLSFDEKRVVEPSDLMTLSLTGEAILISPFGFSRIRKIPYFRDRRLKKMADEIRRYNSTIGAIDVTQQTNNNNFLNEKEGKKHERIHRIDPENRNDPF